MSNVEVTLTTPAGQRHNRHYEARCTACGVLIGGADTKAQAAALSHTCTKTQETAMDTAAKPTRKIAGTDFLARTNYRSADGTVRHYTILTADGVVLGRVSSHMARTGRPAGLHEGHGAFMLNLASWSNLADAAWELWRRTQA